MWFLYYNLQLRLPRVHFNDLLSQMILIKLAYSRKIYQVIFLNQPYSSTDFLRYEKAKIITFDYSEIIIDKSA